MAPLTEARGTDVLADVLYSLQLRGRIFCSCDFTAPWAFGVTPDGFGHFHLIEAGDCWFRLPSRPKPIKLEPGDLMLLLHGSRYTMSGDVSTPAIPLTEIVGDSHGSIRTRLAYGGGGPTTQVICGSFEFLGPQAHVFLSAFPKWIRVQAHSGNASEWLRTTLQYLQREIRSSEMGADLIITSLVDVLFVQAVRTWLAVQPSRAGGWLGALRDPAIGVALGLIHASPQERWTAPRLAREVGMSRSPFCARFAALVGVPPMTYLKQWRLQLATRVLQNPALTLSAVTEHVGYESVEAFSRAFRRQFGIAPGRYRRVHTIGSSG